MSRFGMIVEDPFYDEDGVLIDEDADWEDLDEYISGEASRDLRDDNQS